MTDLPDYYFDLGVKPTASQQLIDQTYTRRANELRASTVEDAPEELADVEAAYAVLRDPSRPGTRRGALSMTQRFARLMLSRTRRTRKWTPTCRAITIARPTRARAAGLMRSSVC